jgi:hypothetical protein
MAKRSKRGRAEPLVLLIGSGIHRQILGERSSSNPLASWRELLLETGRRSGVPVHIVGDASLTSVWEAMVLRAVSHGYRTAHRDRSKPGRQQAAVVDRALRSVCKQVIVDHSADLRKHYAQHWIVQAIVRLCEARQVHLVDFNFDDLISGALGIEGKARSTRVRPPKSSGLTIEEYAALHRNWPIQGRHSLWLWKPHGWIGSEKTMRLGVRDFGLQGAGYRWAFQRHKAAAREGSAKKGLYSETWVAKVLQFECRAVGLGIGADEWGLHWLLTQRARDQVRRRQTRPFTSYLAHERMWPIGVECSAHPTWAVAIEKALAPD